MELNSLRHLLLFSLEQNCHRIQIFGDSQLVINWINVEYHCHLHMLMDLLEDSLSLKSQFDFIVCSHIYRERNEVGAATRTRVRMSHIECSASLSTWLLLYEQTSKRKRGEEA